MQTRALLHTDLQAISGIMMEMCIIGLQEYHTYSLLILECRKIGLVVLDFDRDCKYVWQNDNMKYLVLNDDLNSRKSLMIYFDLIVLVHFFLFFDKNHSYISGTNRNSKKTLRVFTPSG
jgi:hypothetical protein